MTLLIKEVIHLITKAVFIAYATIGTKTEFALLKCTPSYNMFMTAILNLNMASGRHSRDNGQSCILDNHIKPGGVPGWHI